MSIIIAETRNGSAFARSAYVCADEADFVSRIREVADRSAMDEEIESAADACAYLNEKHAQRTEIITEAEFRGADGWDAAVMRAAERAGWTE